VLRDIRTGETITVTNTTPGKETRPGMYLLGRPLPIDNTWRAYTGFILLPPVMLDYAMVVLDEGDPDEVAGLIGSTFAPPQLQNTDGEPIVTHEIIWEITDPKTAATALQAAGLKRDGDTFSLVRDSKNNPQPLKPRAQRAEGVGARTRALPKDFAPGGRPGYCYRSLSRRLDERAGDSHQPARQRYASPTLGTDSSVALRNLLDLYAPQGSRFDTVAACTNRLSSVTKLSSLAFSSCGWASTPCRMSASQSPPNSVRRTGDSGDSPSSRFPMATITDSLANDLRSPRAPGC
jgi:hypothetical protein